MPSTVTRLIPRPLRHFVGNHVRAPSAFWDGLMRAGLPSPVPPTERFKRRVIARYAPGIDTFVETGTFRGDTVEAVRGLFAHVWSIELGHDLVVAAQRRFAPWSNVRIIEGDSGVVLSQILPEIDRRCLFWLDSHWVPGGDTAHGGVETPLLAELRAVLARRERDIILIDDIRLMGAGDYPSIEVITGLVAQASPPRSLRVVHDIARIAPE